MSAAACCRAVERPCGVHDHAIDRSGGISAVPRFAETVQHCFAPAAAIVDEFEDDTGIVLASYACGPEEVAIGCKQQRALGEGAVRAIGRRTETVEILFCPGAVLAHEPIYDAAC